MAVPSLQTYSSGNIDVAYFDVPNEIPKVKSVTFKDRNLIDCIQETISSTLLGTKKYLAYEEHVHLDPKFEALAFQYFDEIVKLENDKPDLAVECADFFFEHVCSLYWSLIAGGSRNLAIAFLKKICLIVNKWENKRKKQIHKGTPYFFLTFGFRQEGDIDSAFASMFKAINEDIKSKDPILGKGAYRTSPAYKYVSIIDDRENYLYDSIIELRDLIKVYIRNFNKASKANPKFTIRILDTRFLQNEDIKLEQIKYLFTYCLEDDLKYRNQIPTLPNNDFYKIRNASFFFNLSLITDKILETRYEPTFMNYVKGGWRGRRKDKMSIGDGVSLLFEDRGWIGKLTPNQEKNPRNSLSISPNLPKNDPEKLIDKLFLNPVPITCNTKPLHYQMKVMLLAKDIRNYAGHNIRKQDVFVEKYPQIMGWLLSSVFIAISNLPKPKKSVKRAKKPKLQKLTVHPVATTTTYVTSATPVVTSAPMGTIGFNHTRDS